jgi:hypothetical protein
LVKAKPWWGPKEEKQRKMVAELLGLNIDNFQVKNERLPSIKEAEQIFADALAASCKPGLDETEAFRLHVVAEIAQLYKEFAQAYVGRYFAGQKVGGWLL